MSRSLGALLVRGVHSLTSVPAVRTQLGHLASGGALRTVVTVPPFLSPKPQDFSLPNSSWGSEMLRLHEHYSSQCEGEMEEGEKARGFWLRLPSYNRSLKYAAGKLHLSKIIQANARFFTRNIQEPGAGFEYVVFVNKKEKRCVCIFQAGHLLEGTPGYVHGGAIATMMDTVAGTHASVLSGAVVTANLNINYRSPIPLGNTVLIESFVDSREGRKMFISCKVTSTDGSKLHTEATALFLSVNVSHLLKDDTKQQHLPKPTAV